MLRLIRGVGPGLGSLLRQAHVRATRSTLQPQQIRWFRHHEKGWWEDDDDGGVQRGASEIEDPRKLAGLFSYVSDARKEEVYRLYNLDPDIFDSRVLGHLFNLSKDRIEAIIKLKAEEVERRKAGRLYTEVDADRQEQKDPWERLLLDDETGEETLEDLTLPPGQEVSQKEGMALQAAMQELRMMEVMGEGYPSSGLEAIITGGNISMEQIDELIKKLDESMVAVQKREDEILDQVPEWEEKPMDECKSGRNGFKFLDAVESQVLSDPVLLHYHGAVNLEQQRIGLIRAQFQAYNDPSATEQDRVAIDQAIRDYTARRNRFRSIFAELDASLRAPASDEQTALANKHAAIKHARAELSKVGLARIADIEDLETEVDQLYEQASKARAKKRQAILSKGLEEAEPVRRKELLQQYVDLLQEEHGRWLRPRVGATFEAVRWEVLQEHRRLARQLPGLFEDYYALEVEVMDALAQLTEGEVQQQQGQAVKGPGQQQPLDLLKSLGSEPPGDGRRRLVDLYLKELFVAFSVDDEEAEYADHRDDGLAPYERFLVDLLMTPLHNQVNVEAVGSELLALLPKEGAPVTTEDFVSSTDAVSFEGAEEVEDKLKDLEGRRLDIVAKVLDGLTTVNTQLGNQLHLLRKYLLLIFVSEKMEAFGRRNVILLNDISSCLENDVASVSDDDVEEVLQLVHDSLYYGDEEWGSEEVSQLCSLTKKSEAWVRTNIVGKIVEKRGQRKISDAGGLVDGVTAEGIWRKVATDLFAKGIRSTNAQRGVQHNLKKALEGLTPDAVREMEKELDVPIDSEEAREALTDGLEVMDKFASGGSHGALMSGREELTERTWRAKEVLDELRGDKAFQAYVAKVQDLIVDEIEEELLDHICELSEEARMEIDPDLRDMKPKEHYDIPSLRFRVFNDTEYAASTATKDGFVAEPSYDIKYHVPKEYPSACPENVTKPIMRYSFAFRDTSSAVQNKTNGKRHRDQGEHSVLRTTTGHLRTMTMKEESQRSWSTHLGRHALSVKRP